MVAAAPFSFWSLLSMAMPPLTWLSWIGYSLFTLVFLIFVLLPSVVIFLTVGLTLVTWFRFPSSAKKTYNTALCTGRVSHMRFQPITHSFSYPMFFCLVDTEELTELFLGQPQPQPNQPKQLNGTHGTKNANQSKPSPPPSRQRPMLWPLSKLIQYRDSDHLKNGEGYIDIPTHTTTCTAEQSNLSDSGNSNSNTNCGSINSVQERIFRLVASKCEHKFEPNTRTHKVLLLTHLSYYGYCFNPVSFYYVLDKSSTSSLPSTSSTRSPTKDEKEGEPYGNRNGNTICAIVAEVSNTPWNEMSCYVLHPDSLDVTHVQPGTSRQGGQHTSNNYIFDKTFHVSPFMDMDHVYDWTFWELYRKTSSSSNTGTCTGSATSTRTEHPQNHRSVVVSTTLKKKEETYFNASFQVTPLPKPLHPWQICKTLLTFPLYTAMVQVWIHYEAIWLFIKGVVFVPHPQGSETKASRMIGSIMEPIFGFKDWIAGKTQLRSIVATATAGGGETREERKKEQ